MNILDSNFSINELKNIIIYLLVYFVSSIILYILINTTSNDVGQYVLLLQRLNEIDYLEALMSLRYEPASLFVLWALGTIFSANMAFYLIGLLALSTKYYLFNKYLNYSSLAFLLYLLTFVHILDANQIRVALAVSVIFFALFIEPKSRFTYLLLTIFACMFHYSAVIILLLYFVNRPIIPLLGIIVMSIIFDSFVASSPYLSFAMIWLSTDSGEVSLTNPFFILQAFIMLGCIINWSNLNLGQRKGALLNMIGVIAYLSFLENPIIAHRIRELSQIGIFGILFLGPMKFTYAKFITLVCFIFMLAYNIFFQLFEILYISDLRL